MIVTKIFSILDRSTFIPVMATSIKNADLEELNILGKAGYHDSSLDLILLCALGTGRTEYDYHEWSNQGRTLVIAHEYIEKNFDSLETGDAIDVREILGEI